MSQPQRFASIKSTGPLRREITTELANKLLKRMVGRRPSSRDRTFQGLIDDVLVFNRALAPEEIHAVYEATRQ